MTLSISDHISLASNSKLINNYMHRRRKWSWTNLKYMPTVYKTSPKLSSLHKGRDCYVIVRMLLQSTFNMRWEPKSPYRSCPTHGTSQLYGCLLQRRYTLEDISDKVRILSLLLLGVKETTKHLSQDTRSLGRDFSPWFSGIRIWRANHSTLTSNDVAGTKFNVSVLFYTIILICISLYALKGPLRIISFPAEIRCEIRNTTVCTRATFDRLVFML
jgi:hypothetical protein